ncbi:hypothetical protein ACMFMG_008897 [Clarireedia jacksonii]
MQYHFTHATLNLIFDRIYTRFGILLRIVHHECFVPPITAPLTSSQLILSSSSSSTSPTTTTLSPLIRYKPCGTSLEASGSSGGRIIRSIVCDNTCDSNISPLHE